MSEQNNWPEELPKDSAKLKLLTREFIVKRCREWEDKVDAFRKQLEEIVAMIDKQWPSVHEFIPCKTRCGRDVEAIVKKIKELFKKGKIVEGELSWEDKVDAFKKQLQDLIKNRPKLDIFTLKDKSVHLRETTEEAFEKLQKMDKLFQKIEELLRKETPI